MRLEYSCRPTAEKGIVQYAEFLRRVEGQIGATRSGGEAERAITATLETLGERISGGEASKLAAQLPGELKALLQRADEEAEEFSLDEFYRRVGEREGVDIETASKDASVVMTVLSEAITAGELRDVLDQLPQNFNRLFGQR